MEVPTRGAGCARGKGGGAGAFPQIDAGRSRTRSRGAGSHTREAPRTAIFIRKIASRPGSAHECLPGFASRTHQHRAWVSHIARSSLGAPRACSPTADWGAPRQLSLEDRTRSASSAHERRPVLSLLQRMALLRVCCPCARERRYMWAHAREPSPSSDETAFPTRSLRH